MDDRSQDGDNEARNPINDLYRLADIKRWHIVRMDQKQSVAEHSFFVSLLAMRLASAIGAPVGRCVQYALLHDAEEAWTGDIPSPLKIEDHDLPLKKMMGDMFVNPAPIVKIVVKLCDLAESIKFLRRNGNSRHCLLVEYQLTDKMWELFGESQEEFPNFSWGFGLGELNWFLEGDDEETYIDDYIGKNI